MLKLKINSILGEMHMLIILTCVKLIMNCCHFINFCLHRTFVQK
jgi:hypothetical protein